MSHQVGAAPRRPVVSRQRLIDRLHRRFDVRLTLVVGGAGSGKTTLLSQAMTNETRHLDIWVPCTAFDRDIARLHTRVGDSLTAALLAAPAPPDLERITELIVSASPRHVCLVLDDVHVLGQGDGFVSLLDALPSNGHLLLAGRSRPPIDTARLDAAGQLEDIAQDELMMTHDEVVALANLRGVDVSQLEGAHGWPAFVELASTGTATRSTRYLDEEALRGLEPERRQGLAAFAFVGGGDEAVAEAVSGRGLQALLGDLPLVRWSGNDATMHDLWVELLAGDLDDQARHDAAMATTAILRERREIDRAIDLAASVGDWEDVATSLRVALRDGVDGGLRADQLGRWRAVLPPDFGARAVRSLVDGLFERERDPTSPLAFEHLERASAGFAAAHDDELELVALAQLGYLARIVHDTDAVRSVANRFAELAERHPPAIPFRAIGEAWVALTTMDAQRRLDVLMPIDEHALPPTWEITRRHLIAHALFNLGRADEGLEIVPERVDDLPVSIPGALGTRSQCLWYAGFPDRALAEPVDGASHRHGARDRFIAAAWLAMMRGFAGDPVGCRSAAAEAVSHVGEQAGPLVRAQLTGLEILARIGDGDEHSAAELLRDVLGAHPLGDGFSEQLFREHFVFCYVLAPETHAYWDSRAIPVRWRGVRDLGRAFALIRQDGDVTRLARVDWPEPGLVAAHIPCRWAIELSLYGLAARRPEARRLAGWLCEHWQAPARNALVDALDDERRAATARELIGEIPMPPATGASFELLGHTEMRIGNDLTAHPDWRRERVRALLTWCALHPDTTRDRAATALWPDAPSASAAKNLRTTLNYLHGVLEPGRQAGDAPWYLRSDGPRLALHASLAIDLTTFRTNLDAAERAERHGHPLEALPLLEESVALWRGDLAADLDHEWLDLERIHTRSRFVRAASRASELLLTTGHPERAIASARRAIDADPYHEPSYRSLAEVYRTVGDRTSARDVLARLADLVDEPTRG